MTSICKGQLKVYSFVKTFIEKIHTKGLLIENSLEHIELPSKVEHFPRHCLVSLKLKNISATDDVWNDRYKG
jgi:hypothetical protein